MISTESVIRNVLIDCCEPKTARPSDHSPRCLEMTSFWISEVPS